MATKRAFNRFWWLLGVGMSSSAIMLWALWHYPLGTGIVIAVVLAGFGISGALTRAVDVDTHSDCQSGGQGAQPS